VLRQGAQVDAVQFEQVVAAQHRRQFGQQFGGQGLAADALLQIGERRRHGRIGLPNQHFAIEHHPVWQTRCRQFREPLGDQVFAARPQETLAIASHELRADAVVLPFHDPVRRLAQARRFSRQLMRQEERVRLPASQFVFFGRLLGDQLQEAGCRRFHAPVGPAHQALGNEFTVHRRNRRQRACDQQARDAHAEPAANQLDEQEALAPIQFVPVAKQRLADTARIGAAQRANALLHPLGEANVGAFGRWRQDVRDGFGKVAHGRVRLVEQPLVQHGVLDGVLAQQFGRHRLARLAAGQEVHGPRCVLGRGIGKICLQCFELAGGRRGFVEIGVQAGEFTHRLLLPSSRSRLVPSLPLLVQPRPLPRPRTRSRNRTPPARSGSASARAWESSRA
jgi:hypothetical protein